MTETATGKIQETQIHRYKSTRGIDYDSVPWRLWERAKELFWNPTDLPFEKDKEDWKTLTPEQQLMLAGSARGFMVGEEAVTLDILPLLRAVSDEGRLEDTIYLSSFAMEEAKHVDFFRRWFDAVEFDPSSLNAFVQQQNQGDGYGGGSNGSENGSDGNGQPRRRGLFDGELTRVMQRLDTDRSPEAYLDASLVYNHLVEGIAAIAGYRRWNAMFAAIGDKMPALQEGMRLIQRDERRHIAYGTYLCRRIIAEHPETWEFVERRWNELTGQMGQAYAQGGAAYGGEERARYVVTLAQRRLEALAVARQQAVTEVEGSAIEAFEPDEM